MATTLTRHVRITATLIAALGLFAGVSCADDGSDQSDNDGAVQQGDVAQGDADQGTVDQGPADQDTGDQGTVDQGDTGDGRDQGDVGDDDGRDDPPVDLPDLVTLGDIGSAGTGCPANTIRGRFPVDPRGLILGLTDFLATAGRGAPARDSRRNCGLILPFEYPEGWQFTVETIAFEGTVDVADNTKAVATADYHFQGDQATVRFDKELTSADNGDFSVVTYPKEDQDTREVWSPCDKVRALVLNFAVRIAPATDGGSAYGEIAFGRTTDGGRTGALLALKWRRCE